MRIELTSAAWQAAVIAIIRLLRIILLRSFLKLGGTLRYPRVRGLTWHAKFSGKKNVLLVLTLDLFEPVAPGVWEVG